MPKPKLLWQPSDTFKSASNMASYIEWLKKNGVAKVANYEELWQWSVDNIESFWRSIWDYFIIISTQEPQQVLSSYKMPQIEWFKGTKVNYTEHIFRNKTTEHPAIIFKNETEKLVEISWLELEQKVNSFKHFLVSKGIGQGDRVAAYLPNIPEATIAFLATSALGAIWSSTSPDFGISSVVDRFAQIEPKLLITVDGYRYGGKAFNRIAEIEQIVQQLPSLKEVVLISYLNANSTISFASTTNWAKINMAIRTPLSFTRVGFNEPIWVLYSSGTTGRPKAITHSVGGVLLEHLKYLSFHTNIKHGERCFWYTTTGWMMWNYIQASLLLGATIVLYDGSPAYPKMSAMWQFIEEAKITHFGTSAGFISASMQAKITPAQSYNLSTLISIGSTGSPLSPESFDWIYQKVKPDVWLTSISGGTDVCSAFVGGNPLLPVYTGEIQCRALGCKLEAYNEAGQPVLEQMGEMVITKPMPSMPIYFWGDTAYKKYNESYFEMYPGIWRHGDWTEITNRSSVIIYGRSDSTLNRGGIRIGTSEIYRAVEGLDFVKDSLVIYLDKGKQDYMPLFVVLEKNIELTSHLVKEIKTVIRKAYTPRHVPDDIIKINEVPYTISGKKMETPIKKILLGQPVEKVISKDAMRNPEAIAFFVELKNTSR